MVEFQEVVKIDDVNSDIIINLRSTIYSSENGYKYLLEFNKAKKSNGYSMCDPDSERFSISLPVYNESFIQQLSNIAFTMYKNYENTIYDSAYCTIKNMNSWIDVPLIQEIFIEYMKNAENINFDYKEIVKLLCMCNIMYIDEQNNIMYEKFIEKYPTIDDVDDNVTERLLYPALHTLDDYAFETFKTMINVYYTSVEKNFKKYTDKSLSMIAKMIYINDQYTGTGILNRDKLWKIENIKNQLVQDINPEGKINIPPNIIISLFIDDETVDYINTLTVNQLYKNIISFVVSKRPEFLNIERAKEIMNNKKPNLLEVMKSVTKFAEKIYGNPNIENSVADDIAIEMLQWYSSNDKIKSFLPLVIEYFNTNDVFDSVFSDLISQDNCNFIENFIEKNLIRVDGYTYIDSFIYVNKIGLNNYVKLLSDLDTVDFQQQNINIHQMNNYVDHYEEYKDMPFAWSLELTV